MINLLKWVFSHILILYKNFFFWNLHKLLIFVYSAILGLLMYLPFFLIIFIFWLIDPSFKNNMIAIESLSDPSYYNDIIYLVIFYSLHFLWFSFFLLWVSYYVFLFSRLYFYYIDKVDFSYKDLFSIYFIWPYFKILLKWWLYLLIPIIIFIVLSILNYFISGLYTYWFDSINSLKNFQVLESLIIIFSIFLFVYTSFRLVFSYILLSRENWKEFIKPASYYIKESIDLSKSKFLKSIFIFLIILIFLSLFTYLFWLIIVNVYISKIIYFLLFIWVTEMSLVSILYFYIKDSNKSKDSKQLNFNFK